MNKKAKLFGFLILGLILATGLGWHWTSVRKEKTESIGSGSIEKQSAPSHLAQNSASENINTNKANPSETLTMEARGYRTAQKSNGSRTVASVDKSPEEVLAFLEKKYRTRASVDKTPSGENFRLYGNYKLDMKDSTEESQAIDNFMLEVSGVFGVNPGEQLTGKPQYSNSPLGNVFDYQQTYEGIVVDGALLRIMENNRGEVYMVNSSLIPNLQGIDVRPNLTSAAAIEIAKKYALDQLDPQNRRPPAREPTANLVIHNFSSSAGGRPDLAWRVPVFLPWLGAQGANDFYVNAHTGAVDRVPTGVE